MRLHKTIFFSLFASCTSVDSLQFSEPVPDMHLIDDFETLDSAKIQDLSCESGPTMTTELPDIEIYKRYNKINCKCEKICTNGTYDSCNISLKKPADMNIIEVCNDVDDDCDGFIDEGAQPLSPPTSEQYQIKSKEDGSWDHNCDLKVYMSLCSNSIQPVLVGINKLHYFSTKNTYTLMLGDSICSTYSLSDCPSVMIYIDSKEPTCGQTPTSTAQRAVCAVDSATMKCKAQTATSATGTIICCV